MKKLTKYVGIILAIAVTVSFAGCSLSKENYPESQNTPEKVETDIDIEDISWKIEPGNFRNNDTMMLSLENNSEFPITEFIVSFEEKKDADKKALDEIDDYVKANLIEGKDAPDPEYKLDVTAKARTLVNPGETSSAAPLKFYNDSAYVKKAEDMDLVEPSAISISYRKDNIIKSEVYTFDEKVYSGSISDRDCSGWANFDLISDLPEYKTDFLVNESYSDDRVRIDVYDVTEEDFNNYVTDCKNAGFTIKPTEEDGMYSATNENSHYIDLQYTREHKLLMINVINLNVEQR